MVEFLRRRAIPGIERVDDDGYARTVHLDGVYGTVAVRPGDGNSLRATVRFPKLTALPTIIARLRRVFDLAADPVAIAGHLTKDPTLAPLVRARPGLRVPGAWDGFELASRAVLGQQITVTAAIRLAGRLVAAYGQGLPQPDGGFDSRLSRNPKPWPGLISHPSACRAAGRQRSRPWRRRPWPIPTCSTRPAASTRRSGGCARSRGVGEWTAQYIALRQLREPDAFPAADAGLMRAIARREGHGCTSSQLLDRADTWRPWRAYAAQHLWASA